MSRSCKSVLLAGIFVGALACSFLIISFLLNPPPENPPVVIEPQWDNPQTREFFMRACGDCHSNQTIWPWYSRVPLVAQLIRHDVSEGRSRFNVSEWGRSSENEGDDAAEVVLEGEMPPGIYLPMHPNARLSPSEKKTFVDGLIKTFGGEIGESESDDD